MISPGQCIGGRYEVLEHIGRGGMQDVYKSKDNLLSRVVAIKVPQPGQAERRFEQSAKYAARVNHHNVAKTLDYHVDGQLVYLVEEFVPGQNLEEKLRLFSVLDPHLGAKVLHHLSKGLVASHHAGVIHRDLKPTNIMTSHGVNFSFVKITDFGIATLTEQVFEEAAQNGGDLSRSTSGTVRGALPYMAPEMMFRKPGENPGTPIDVWSLGALMFRLLAGEYPFGLYLEAAVNVRNRTRQNWPAFMTVNPQFAPLAKELQNIIDACLAYEPSERPTADKIVALCGDLCYLDAPRVEGTVTRLIQNGYSGFAQSANSSVFFSMESVYGPRRPSDSQNRHICYSSFPGAPNSRAHPVLVLQE